MMDNPIAVLNGDQVYLDELIRENARLTVQHEADQQIIQTLQEHSQEECNAKIAEAYAACSKANLEVRSMSGKLNQAITDLHFVMAGGDPCEVCATRCLMGEGNCKPVWRGEKVEGRPE